MLSDLVGISVCLIALRGVRRHVLGLRIVAPPAIGGRLVLSDARTPRRVTSGRIVRILKDVDAERAYVQTGESLYVLRADRSGVGCSDGALSGLAARRGWKPTMARAYEAHARAWQRIWALATLPVPRHGQW